MTQCYGLVVVTIPLTDDSGRSIAEPLIVWGEVPSAPDLDNPPPRPSDDISLGTVTSFVLFVMRFIRLDGTQKVSLYEEKKALN